MDEFRKPVLNPGQAISGGISPSLYSPCTAYTFIKEPVSVCVCVCVCVWEREGERERQTDRQTETETERKTETERERERERERKNNLGMKRFILFTVPCCLKQWGQELVQDRNLDTEVMEECCLLACSVCFLMESKTTAQGWHHPQWGFPNDH